MTASKRRAYTSEYGAESVTATEVMRQRNAWGGKSLPDNFWSNHQTGARRSVSHVKETLKRGPHFRYRDGEGGGAGIGESLSHWLLKRAISQMAGTRLKLGKDGEHDIQVVSGETEKLISGSPYRADAYLRFTSPASRLALQWEEEVYVEVKHTHAVPVPKQRALIDIGVPVIEVPIPPSFMYDLDEETSTDAQEAAHVARLCHVLQTGFLRGTVISNRRSAEFLEQLNNALQSQLDQAKQKLADANNAEQWATAQMKTLAAQCTQLERQVQDESQDRLKQRVLRQSLEKELSHRVTTVERQTTELRYWRRGAGAVLVLGLTLAFIDWHSTREAAMSGQPAAVVVEPTPSPASTSQPDKVVKPNKHGQVRSKRATASAPVTDH